MGTNTQAKTAANELKRRKWHPASIEGVHSRQAPARESAERRGRHTSRRAPRQQQRHQNPCRIKEMQAHSDQRIRTNMSVPKCMPHSTGLRGGVIGLAQANASTGDPLIEWLEPGQKPGSDIASAFLF